MLDVLLMQHNTALHLNFTDFFRRAEKMRECDLLPPLQFVTELSDHDMIVAKIKSDRDKIASHDGKAKAAGTTGTDDGDYLLETRDTNDDATAAASVAAASDVA